MKTKLMLLFFTAVLLVSCKNQSKSELITSAKSDFTIALGSCNKVNLTNYLWDDIRAFQPDVFIWGGDIIYADSGGMNTLALQYQQQNAVIGYQALKEETEILATWDDHDYGINDGGAEFEHKDQSQQFFLDFLGLPQDDPRRTQKGVYHTKTYSVKDKKIKIIVLDTRYFRTPLTNDPTGEKRYIPNPSTEGTLLGARQWQWLEAELLEEAIDYTVVMSSIQMLSSEHGFESWGNMPHEMEKFMSLIKSTQASNVMVVSGDRHISEFSKLDDPDLDYPLVDFTSSGLTHSYTTFEGEPNKYRVGEVLAVPSFGLIQFDLTAEEVSFSMHTNKVPFKQELIISYR